MTFEDLNIKKPLLQALNELGYDTPTNIQAAGYSVIMSGKDVVGLAQTGTGKTLAYLLPTLSMWKFSKEPHPQILVIVPTRELVAQVVEEVERLTNYINVVVGGVYGGANINTQAALVLQGLDILVGTPGRILDLCANGSLQLKQAKKVVIDEVDETLSLGFRPQLLRIFEYLPEKRQNLLFSATLSEEVEVFIENYFTNPITIEAAGVGTPLENIEQVQYAVPNFTTKLNLLNHLLNSDDSMKKVLVFVASRSLADRLFEAFEQAGHDQMGVIHSNKAQNNRFHTVRDFEAGIIRVLIATDVIARGVDVSDVTHVINFDIPENQENYIHRIGRTGRYDKHGKAIAFVSEKDYDAFQAIQQFMSKEVVTVPLPEDVEYSDVLLEFEKALPAMKNVLVKLPKREEVGPAFHEKKAKNKKVNVRYNHKKAMQEKYGKPKKRRSKK
jgi:ATP-dependent RNA helicase RhlE